MTADAYATALLVMGDVEGPVFAEAAGLAALFIVRAPRAQGGFEITHTGAMVRYLGRG